MSNHTLGPWVETVDASGWGLDGANGEQVIFVYDDGTIPTEANARLIAAAPDLLDALEFIEIALGSRVEARTAEALQRKARLAIAKAKGE